MKLPHWMVAAMIVGGVVFAYRGCLNELEPDEQLADHLDELCDIARDRVDAPERGVRELGHYLNRHARDMMADLGSTVALIERIDDDRKHDARARVARDRLRAPVRACERDWERFGRAVEANPAAKRVLDRGIKRLNRTMEIIFSSAGVDLLTVPPLFVRATASPSA